ncbi:MULTISPECIES: hypothetical protein [Emticicia]|uniref:hypothetical protein n=1 Tax=Emticicia TaxID=312278 RepID=UPI0007D8B510|nr:MULTISPECIES: hypothetical protein [Emticicia]
MQPLALDNYGTSELSFDEQRETDGGDLGKWISKICEKAIKITDNGTLLDGIPNNTNIDCYLFGIKIF